MSKKHTEDKTMTLSGHLKELRNRLMICLLCLLAVFLVSFHYAGDIVDLLTDIGLSYGYDYVYLSPQ